MTIRYRVTGQALGRISEAKPVADVIAETYGRFFQTLSNVKGWYVSQSETGVAN